MMRRTHYAGLRGNRDERRYKSTGGGDSTSTSEPWAGAQPFITQGYQAAQSNILNNPTQFFPGSTTVPFSPETTAALGAQTNRAISGSPVLGAAQDYTQGLLTDPTNTPLYDAIRADVLPSVAGTFASAGRTGGSPLAAEAAGTGIARGLAPYMESAASRAPGLAEADYGDIDRLGQVGAAREGQAGRELQDQISRFDFAQNEPANRTSAFNSSISGIPIAFNQSSSSRNNVNVPLYAAGSVLQGAGAGGVGK